MSRYCVISGDVHGCCWPECPEPIAPGFGDDHHLCIFHTLNVYERFRIAAPLAERSAVASNGRQLPRRSIDGWIYYVQIGDCMSDVHPVNSDTARDIAAELALRMHRELSHCGE